MSKSQFCLLALLITQVSQVTGQGLRGQRQVSAKDVESSLLAELAGTMRSGSMSDHVSSLEAALTPMYKSVPKESDGTLSHAVVCYMLHRFFVQENGWFIRGLEPGSGSLNATGNNSQEWVASYLQSFLEELQGGRGISLRELAVLAGTFEDLIHKETVTRLETAFTALEIQQHRKLNEAELKQALEVFMMIYMLGGNFSVKGRHGVVRAHKIFSDKLKDWEKVQDWMHSIQLQVAPASDHEAVNFTDATRVVEEVGKRYGKYNDGECMRLKSQLLDIESTKAGRVRLNEFYKKGLSGVFEFNEKIDYLRTLGAIDESDPENPHVIVPNYVASRPNCLMASGFYVVCCRNECEDLMSSLERKMEAPMATSKQVIEHVSSLSSATVKGPRALSDTLMQRLDSIAQANDGMVPLHGRLFAQWMHHAFPRECPYPHQSGTASPQTPDEWMQSTGEEDTKHSTEELQARVDGDACTLPVGAAAREHHDLKENELPWDDTEELLRPAWSATKEVPQAPAQRRSLFTWLGLASSVAGVAMFVFKMMPWGKTSSMYLPA